MFDTPAGYVIYSQLPEWTRDDNAVTASTITLARIHVEEVVVADPPIPQLWELEPVGISFEKFSHLQEKTVDFFKSTTKYSSRGYTVRLPFKSDHLRPARNLSRAVVQLYQLRKSKDSSIYAKYRKILDEYLASDFIEEVPSGTRGDVDGKTHYLPHHPVIKNSPTTPVRIVFNASSRETKQSYSLNDVLYTGPNLAQKIHDMILMF